MRCLRVGLIPALLSAFLGLGACAQIGASASRPSDLFTREATVPVFGVSGRIGALLVHPDRAKLYVVEPERRVVTKIDIVERKFVSRRAFPADGLGGLCLVGRKPRLLLGVSTDVILGPKYPMDATGTNRGVCWVLDDEKFGSSGNGLAEEPVVVEIAKLPISGG